MLVGHVQDTLVFFSQVQHWKFLLVAKSALKMKFRIISRNAHIHTCVFERKNEQFFINSNFCLRVDLIYSLK